MPDKYSVNQVPARLRVSRIFRSLLNDVGARTWAAQATNEEEREFQQALENSRTVVGRLQVPLEEAPTFHPTPEEWSDPIKYINRSETSPPTHARRVVVHCARRPASSRVTRTPPARRAQHPEAR